MMKIVLIAGLLVMSGIVLAQDKYFYINLDVSKPLSNTSWASDVSARGARIGYRSFITKNISAGIDLGWNVFDKYSPRQTFETGSGAITTDYFNYIYSYSIIGSGQYYFNVGKGDKIRPYVGMGLGASNQEYVKYYNFYSENDAAWGFLARPEAGALVMLNARRTIGAMAALHYDYSTNRIRNFDYQGFSALGFQIGLVFMDP